MPSPVGRVPRSHALLLRPWYWNLQTLSDLAAACFALCPAASQRHDTCFMFVMHLFQYSCCPLACNPTHPRRMTTILIGSKAAKVTDLRRLGWTLVIEKLGLR